MDRTVHILTTTESFHASPSACITHEDNLDRLSEKYEREKGDIGKGANNTIVLKATCK